MGAFSTNPHDRTSLDSIGLAGFSHNFGSLEGKQCGVADVFNATSQRRPSALATAIMVLGQVLPVLRHIPNEMHEFRRTLNQSMGAIAAVLLAKTRRETREFGEGDKEEKSIIGLLSKSTVGDVFFRSGRFNTLRLCSQSRRQQLELNDFARRSYGSGSLPLGSIARLYLTCPPTIDESLDLGGI